MFAKLCRIVHEESGIRIEEDKRMMLASRVAERLRVLKLEDEEQYLRYLETDFDDEITSFLDVISTNVTEFFRDREHFDFTGDAVAHWCAAGQTRLRFWSAACSTGEEPYSLAMTVLEAMRRCRRRLDARILATDISTRALSHARRGVYTEEKVDAIPERLRDRYLERQDSNGQVFYAVKPVLREMILFRRINLSRPPFPMRGPMDLIYCRNVMFYFDSPVQDRLLGECHRLLRRDGYLFVGLSESLTRRNVPFTRSHSSIYRRKG